MTAPVTIIKHVTKYLIKAHALQTLGASKGQ